MTPGGQRSKNLMKNGATVFWPLVMAAAVLRAPGMFHDFWFDEAWSYLLVREFVSSPADILTRLHVDNNHPLNSFVLYVLGDPAAWSVYRVPSFVFGVAAVVLSGLIMARRGRAHAVAAMILVGCSYPLVVYSSEARGYSAMVFFALLAVDSYERYLVSRGWLALGTFWTAVILGFLSHLTFVHAYGAILIWAVYHARQRSADPHEILADVTASQAVPLLFLAGLHHVYIRHLHVAGGEPASLGSVLAETVGVTAGTPAHGAWRMGAALVLAGVLVTGLVAVWRAHRGLFVLFVSGILLVPAFAVVVQVGTATMEPRFFPRYFLVSITLFLLVAAWLAGAQWQQGGRRRLTAAVLVAAYLAGNLWQVASFAMGGRGKYLEALNHMVRASHDSTIRVSSNSDLRTSVLLAFYRRYLSREVTLVFLPRTPSGAGGADWRIREEVVPTATVPRETDDERGWRFRLVAQYAFYGLSGCQWSLYERADPSDRGGGPVEHRPLRRD